MVQFVSGLFLWNFAPLYVWCLSISYEKSVESEEENHDGSGCVPFPDLRRAGPADVLRPLNR
jgi:hypothetical protein